MRRLQVILVILVLALVSCGPTPTPRVIRETVVVEVTRLVEQQVTVLVTQPPLATHTPGPTPTPEVIREPTATSTPRPAPTAIKASPIATRTTIPVLTSTPTPAPTSMPEQTITVEDPLSLEALSYATDWFATYLLGVVKNNGTKAVSDADIKVVFYKGKTIVEEEYGWTMPTLAVIGPGEKAPFSIYLPDEEWDSFKMVITPGTRSARYYHNPALNLVSHKLTMDGDVRGEIQNTGDVSIKGIHIAVTGYDDQGNLVAVAEGTTKADTVPAGEGTFFEIGSWDGDSHEIDTYELRILSSLE